MLWAFPLLAAFTGGAIDVGSRLPDANEAVNRMIEHDSERQSALEGHRAMHRYVLDNRAFHKHAEMVVRLTPAMDGLKQFEIISTRG